MNKILCFIIVSLIGFQSFAQIRFEQGYYIDNNGNKTLKYNHYNHDKQLQNNAV